jgi:hypothetical protein
MRRLFRATVFLIAFAAPGFCVWRPLSWIKLQQPPRKPDETTVRVAYHGSAPRNSQGRLSFSTQQTSGNSGSRGQSKSPQKSR